MKKSFKYRLYPTWQQEAELSRTLETHRRLYNRCLDERQLCYETAGVSLSYVFQSRRLTITRKSCAYMQQVNRASLNRTVKRLDRSYENFFRRAKQCPRKVGFPRFASRDRFNSFEYKYGNGSNLIGTKLRLQFIGHIKVRLHRPVEGVIKAVRLKREAGKWYAVFSCEVPDPQPAQHTGTQVGIDVGISHFLTTSDGETEPTLKPHRNASAALRRANRALSRKKNKKSRRRKAAKRRLQRLHAKVRNQRSDRHWKIARRLADRYSLVSAESLQIKNMIRHPRLSRSIADAGWGLFLQRLQFKARESGTVVVLVDPAGTSQECSECGEVVQKTLSTRTHRCTCGYTADRDVNAARNILARGQVRREPAECKRKGSSAVSPTSRL